MLSRYLEDDLNARERRALESHVHGCSRCRRELASLANTVCALGSLEAVTSPGLADSIITALRSEDAQERATSRRAPDTAGLPALTVVPGAGPSSAGNRILTRWPQEARTALRWCLQRPQLRLTVPITVVAGVVLSLVNMGGMLMDGKIDLGVCLSCAADFLVPFLALNLALLMLLRLPSRKRAAGSRTGARPLA
jgi:anti-sigma factor RsiW